MVLRCGWWDLGVGRMEALVMRGKGGVEGS